MDPGPRYYPERRHWATPRAVQSLTFRKPVPPSNQASRRGESMRCQVSGSEAIVARIVDAAVGANGVLHPTVFAAAVACTALLALWMVIRPSAGNRCTSSAVRRSFLAMVPRRLLPESPRWLASRGSLQQADRIVTAIDTKYEHRHPKKLPDPLSACGPKRSTRTPGPALPRCSRPSSSAERCRSG